MPMLVSFVPAGSFPHRVGLVMSEYQSTGNSDLAAQLLRELLETEEQGAIYCELMARLKPNSVFAAQCAKAGLERLSTDAFQRDTSPFVTEPGYVREVICSLLVWLQQTSDDDAEKIAKLAETQLKNHDGNPINIRPLLILIRSQRDKPSEEVLASLLPVVWEGGLKAWVEADLKSLSATAPTESKKYFSPASLEILNEGHSKTTKKDKSNAMPPVKPASNPISVKDIALDEEWDLDD
jgi:hypothetical protein